LAFSTIKFKTLTTSIHYTFLSHFIFLGISYSYAPLLFVNYCLRWLWAAITKWHGLGGSNRHLFLTVLKVQNHGAHRFGVCGRPNSWFVEMPYIGVFTWWGNRNRDSREERRVRDTGR
jgi:hypothetical protein